MPTLLITGSTGLLGSKLARLARERYRVVGLGRAAPDGPPLDYDFRPVDIRDRRAVAALVQGVRPHLIIHTAAMTAVDRCETSPEEAEAINVAGSGHVATAAAATGAHLIAVSTDYVFDGESGPYAEHDDTNPLSTYGRTKLEAERRIVAICPAACIARTSVLYGAGPGVRSNFVFWVLGELRAGRPITLVADQTGSPTLADDLAALLLGLAGLGASGLFHTSGSESINRFDFGCRIARTFGLDPGLIRRGATAELYQPAPRPKHSGLVVGKVTRLLGRSPLDVDSGLAALKRQLETAAP
ncbi:MAG: dTDP-4-dehydrorhamnose reductase [Dehalococcoidia bacterium]|nr:dTDP-4-dehydrorhamnose reductase [Dehalococcoidia bacterium]